MLTNFSCFARSSSAKENRNIVRKNFFQRFPCFAGRERRPNTIRLIVKVRRMNFDETP